MKEKNYFTQRNIENLEKIRILRKELPPFCSEFIVGIETRTSPLTRLGYCYDLRIFFDYLISENVYFDGKNIKDITIQDLENVTSTDIELFMEYLSSYEFDGNHYQNSLKTKARKLSTVRAFFKYFYNKDKLQRDVASKVSTPKLHDKPIIRLDNDEIDEMLGIVDSGITLSEHQSSYHSITRLRDLAILTLFLGTGIRISELVGINIDDIDFENNAFKITRKGGNETILYFSDEVKYALYDYYIERINDNTIRKDEKAFFISMQKKRIGVRAVELLVKKYASLATPLKHITPHKLRSTYGTNLYRETKDIYVVAEVLGHRDVNTTKKHYAAISEDIKRDASDKVILRKTTLLRNDENE